MLEFCNFAEKKNGMIENTYNYYCDESCHLRNDQKSFMVLGYISVPYNRIKRFKEEIKEIRQKHKNSLEVKWTNLNQWNYAFYSDLVDFFFDRMDLNFRAILVDKNRYAAEKCGNDYDRFYYLMYYQLIYHKLDICNEYNIYLDIKDELSTYRINELKNILNVKMGTIKKIQHIRSHEVDLLQLCDLFIGAISYSANEKEQKSISKMKLIEKIKKRSNCDLFSQTPKNEIKFNLFRIRI